MADPTPAAFYERWKRNTALAETCGTALPDGRDWEIVFRFYAAVHLVEGYLRTKARQFWAETHEQRRQRFREAPEIRQARVSYADLEDLSKQVRYDPQYTPDAGAYSNAKKWAAQVESVVRAKLERAL